MTFFVPRIYFLLEFTQITEILLKDWFLFLIVSERPRTRRDLAERAEYSTDETNDRVVPIE